MPFPLINHTRRILQVRPAHSERSANKNTQKPSMSGNGEMALPQPIYCQLITDQLERNWNTRIWRRLKGAFLLAWRWCRGGELNSLRRPFQGRALPVSYPGTGAVKDSTVATQGCQCSRG